MQQSNVIFGALLLAFIVFITVRGELPTYLTLLRGGGNQSGATPAAQGLQGLTGLANGLGNLPALNTANGNTGFNGGSADDAINYLYPNG